MRREPGQRRPLLDWREDPSRGERGRATRLAQPVAPSRSRPSLLIEKALTLLAICLLGATPAAVAGNAGGAGGARYEGVKTAPGRVVVRGEGSPLLYIGGTLGITAEVFLGDIPVGPDESGDGTGGATNGGAGNRSNGATDPVREPGGADGAYVTAGSSASGPGGVGSAGRDDTLQSNESGAGGDSFLPPRPSGITLPGIKQNLDLVVDARFGDAVQAFTRLSTQGFWGVGSPSDASPWMPAVARPLFVDEAWARYSGKRFHVSAGKRRFSLGPVGLLGRTDLEAPEGVYADASLGTWRVTGMWSRLSSGYYYSSSFVTLADDLFALRVEKSWRDVAVGWNYLASGLGDESGYSLDLAGSVFGRNVAAEVALFRSSSTLYSEFRTDGWVPAILGRVEPVNTPVHRLGVSYGRIARGFAPYYSSVASRSGGQGIPFDQNTEGVAANYDRLLSADTELSLRATWLRFLDDTAAHGAPGVEGQSQTLTQAEITPTLTASVQVTRDLGPNTSARVGYEHWWMEGGRSYGRLTAGLAVNF
ncbi:MAG: hypothetical protein ACM309_11125 [Bacillota bacterium]